MIDPIIYNRIFQRDQDGLNILEELTVLYYDRQSHTRGDTHETAFKEGQRSVVRFILNKSGITGGTDGGEMDTDRSRLGVDT